MKKLKKKPKKRIVEGKQARAERHEMFCMEYLKDQNASRAARAAGYSEDASKEIGHRLLTKDHIKARLRLLFEERNARTLMEGDQILLETKKLADSDIRRLFHPKSGTLLPMDEWPDDIAKAVSSVKVKELYNRNGVLLGYVKEVKLWDKPKPLEMLGKNKKLWIDVVEGTNTTEVTIVDQAQVKKTVKELNDEV